VRTTGVSHDGCLGPLDDAKWGFMNREQTNRVRFVMEEILPPFVRDSALFRQAAKLAWGGHIDALADFRKRAPLLSSAEYEALYRDHPRVHDDTDNSQACIDKIAANVVGTSICDVGCGTGHLLRVVRQRKVGELGRAVGVDFVIPEHFSPDGLEFVEAQIEKLPFDDQEFDTVVCTHVIEHILDYRTAIAELRRITKRRLIIVVPREREAIYTFNPHFNFFPYKHSFLRAMIPLKEIYECADVGRDIYYQEDM
jgi:2-polyprenyl-3-methyl-5-hydroxy-6-metoxy-1,4-benzoquinol methylase